MTSRGVRDAGSVSPSDGHAPGSSPRAHVTALFLQGSLVMEGPFASTSAEPAARRKGGERSDACSFRPTRRHLTPSQGDKLWDGYPLGRQQPRPSPTGAGRTGFSRRSSQLCADDDNLEARLRKPRIGDKNAPGTPAEVGHPFGVTQGATRKKAAQSTPKRARPDVQAPRWRVTVPAEMHERAERLEELITERVAGSGAELAMMYARFPEEAKTRLERLERAWHLLNGTDGDVAATLLLAVEITAAVAGRKGKLEDAEWIRSQILRTVRESDDASSLPEELEQHPSKPLVALVEVVRLRGWYAKRGSGDEHDDGKHGRWMLKFAALMNKLRPEEWPVREGGAVERHVDRIRRSIGWPSARKLKVRSRRPRKSPPRS